MMFKVVWLKKVVKKMSHSSVSWLYIYGGWGQTRPDLRGFQNLGGLRGLSFAFFPAVLLMWE
ncbi:MAG: hypothetical protein DWQ02_13150 [Bacteroidetes bacterium]|nr:MAG: hypothetical protein DWQ02_13150 [Bacteroidota bacterium]